jgi:macrophage erythroblast attacher
VLRGLDAMIARMRGVKRKLDSHADEEARLHAQAMARIRHLDELYALRTVDDVKYEAWSRRRLDRLVADYLLRHGHNESARQLAAERGMESLVDVDTFVAMSRIRDSLLAGSVTEALAWCADNKKELRKMESKLEFMLRFQQYIELIRTGSEPKLLEAIAHAKKHLIPHHAQYPKEVRQVCGLLAIPPRTAASQSYADLYRPRWTELADLFTTTHNTLLSLPAVPLLHVALSSGLSALKTPACHSSASHQHDDTTSTPGKGVCPICSTELNDLAKNVPYAHHTKSHVEHDLLLLPSGRARGKQRLLDEARKAGLGPGWVKDPVSGDVVPFDELRRVFIT